MGNDGTIINLNGKDLKPVFVKFKASPHSNFPFQKYMTSFMYY